MNKGLFCHTCNEGPFRNSNGLRGHRQFAHGVPPNTGGARSQTARSLETRLSNKVALLENVVPRMMGNIVETHAIYCPQFCGEKLEYVEEAGGTGFRCPTCHYALSIE